MFTKKVIIRKRIIKAILLFFSFEILLTRKKIQKYERIYALNLTPEFFISERDEEIMEKNTNKKRKISE